MMEEAEKSLTNMEDMDYSYYDYQYSDWALDTVDLHFVSGNG
jgi:hypothetical protein